MTSLIGLSICILAGCTPSKNSKPLDQRYPNLVELSPPPDQQVDSSKVYIDSVEVITHEDAPALLVKGSFPDGCTRLEKAVHQIQGRTIELSLIPWKDPEIMCTQVLTPFSFLYRQIPDDTLTRASSVSVNGKTFPIQ